jgi:hypothetical protein
MTSVLLPTRFVYLVRGGRCPLRQAAITWLAGDFCNNIGPSRRFGPGRARRLCPDTSDVNLLCYGQRVVDLNPKVAHCALDFRMAEE